MIWMTTQARTIKLPDLSFNNGLTYASWMSNNNYKITYQIKNIGNKNSTSSIKITCYNKNVKNIHKYIYVPSLLIGKNTTKKTFITSAENFPITCMIDINKEINELNETNNVVKIILPTILDEEETTGTGITNTNESNSILVHCDDLSHNEKWICVANVKVCPIDNWQGKQYRWGYYRGDCSRYTCNEWYDLKNNVCIKQKSRMPWCSSYDIQIWNQIWAWCDTVIMWLNLISYQDMVNCPSWYKVPSINDFLVALWVTDFSSFGEKYSTVGAGTLNVNGSNTFDYSIISNQSIYNLITNLQLRWQYWSYYTSDWQIQISKFDGTNYLFTYYKGVLTDWWRNLRCIKE